MKNSYGLDVDYFRKKLKGVISSIDNTTPIEMSRSLARLAKTADESVLAEPEFLAEKVPHAAATALALLNKQELGWLKRFVECCEDSDSGGHDLRKEEVKRLCKIGVLRNCGFGRSEITEFGDRVLEFATNT